MGRSRFLAALLALGGSGFAAAPAAAQEPLGAPGDTSRIQYVESTTTADGFNWDFFRNLAYPCSVSGYQTFAIGTRIGSSAEGAQPLWVRMRGGGVGFFSADGKAQPSNGNKTEDGINELIGFAEGSELNNLVDADPAGFRTVSVSMCSHDLYAGGDQRDPNNPNLAPDGQPRRTNGLFATKAAIQYTQDRYPTTATFLHGTSAGSAGTFHVAYGLQKQDRPVAGFVADSGVVNEQSEIDQNNAGGPCARGAGTLAAIGARIHPELADPLNQPHLLIARGELTAPVFNVWNRNDSNACGEIQIPCTLPDGSVRTLGGMECRMERVSTAIAALPASRNSRTARLCVRAKDKPLGDCTRHVLTGVKASMFPNTDPSFPADYNAEIMSWVRGRLADRPPELGVGVGRAKRLTVRGGRLDVRCEVGGYERRVCRAKVLQLLPKGKARKIGSGEGAIRAGGTERTLRVELSAAGRRALRDSRGSRGLRVAIELRVDEEVTGRSGEAERRARVIDRR